jgi:hypothetical protein
LQTDEELAAALYELENQSKAAGYAADEIKKILSKRMEVEDVTNIETENFEIGFKGKNYRSVNTREVAMIVVPAVFKQIAKVNVGSVEKLMKSGELTEDQTAQLKGVFSMEYGELKPNVVKKG